MKLIKTLLITLVATFSLASCNSNDAKQTVQYRHLNNISYVTDLTTNESQMLQGAVYTLDFDLIAGKAAIDISNLFLTLGGAPQHVIIESTPYKEDSNGAIVVSVPNTTSLVGGMTHNISNFRLSQNMAFIPALGQTAVYYAVSFEIDGKYSVTAVQSAAYFPGQTLITPTAEGTTPANSNRTFYSYLLNREKGTATLSVYALDCNGKYYHELDFEELPFTVNSLGININAEGNFTAKQPSGVTSDTPFVAKSIIMDSRYDTSTRVRILTDDCLIDGTLSYRYRSNTPQ